MKTWKELLKKTIEKRNEEGPHFCFNCGEEYEFTEDNFTPFCERCKGMDDPEFISY